MNKNKLRLSIANRKINKQKGAIKKWWTIWTEDTNRKSRPDNIRRFNKIKAQKLIIRADCYKCRLKLMEDGYPEPENHGYNPLDWHTCIGCRLVMKGGLHNTWYNKMEDIMRVYRD